LKNGCASIQFQLRLSGITVQSSSLPMARKPPSSIQRLLEFPPDPDDAPATHDNVPPHPEGSHHAVQDDGSRTPPATNGDTRAAPQEADAAADAGPLFQRAEDPPRSLEEPPLSGETGQRPEPDRERGPGDRPEGTGGLFAL